MSGGGTGWSLRCLPNQTLLGFKSISVGCSLWKNKMLEEETPLGDNQSTKNLPHLLRCGRRGFTLILAGPSDSFKTDSFKTIRVGLLMYIFIHWQKAINIQKAKVLAQKRYCFPTGQLQALLLADAEQLLGFPGIYPDVQPEVLGCCCRSIWSETHLRSHLGSISESSHNTLKLGSYHKNTIWIIYSLSPSFFLFFSLPGRWTQTPDCKGRVLRDCTRKLQEKHVVFNYLTVKTYGNNLWDLNYFYFLSWTTLFW